MHSANVDMVAAAAEKDFLKSADLPVASHHPTTDSSQSRAQKLQSRRAMMSRIQHLCFLLLAVTLLAITFVNAGTIDRSRKASSEAQRFRELLETVDATTLHDVLHEHLKEKYQHGVWPEDKTALEALRKENAEVAQNLVQLAKRQAAGNGTVTTITTQFTEITTEVTVTSTSTPAPPPPDTTTTPPASTTEVPPTTTPTPTPPPPTTTTSSTTSSIVSSSTTNSSPSSTLSTTTSSRTSSSASSTTASSSRTSGTSSEVTTEVVFTTTLADGGASIVTRVTVVPAGQGNQPTGSSRTNTANASLQTGNGANALEHGWTAGVGLIGMALVWAL